MTLIKRISTDFIISENHNNLRSLCSKLQLIKLFRQFQKRALRVFAFV